MSYKKLSITVFLTMFFTQIAPMNLGFILDTAPNKSEAEELRDYVKAADIEKIKNFIKKSSNSKIITNAVPISTEIYPSPLFHAVTGYANNADNRSQYAKIITMFLNVPDIDLVDQGESLYLLLEHLLPRSRYGQGFETFIDTEKLIMDEKNDTILKRIIEDPRFDPTASDGYGRSTLSRLLWVEKKSPYIWKLLESALNNPRINVSLIDNDTWKSLAIQAFNEEKIELFSPLYRLLHEQDWFKNLEIYPIFYFVGDLARHGKINKATAQAFLALDKNKPLEDDVNKKQLIKYHLLKEGETIDFTKNPQLSYLNSVLKAYQYAQKNTLKKTGKYLYNSMFLRAYSDMPDDVTGIITSFMQPEQFINIMSETHPQEKRKIEDVVEAEESKKKK